MIDERIIVAGFGGQGVLMIGKLLAHAGMMEGKQVSWLPSYGPEMRGGTANCHVIIADHAIGSPVVTQASGVIVMNPPALEKFEASVKPGGRLLINSSLSARTASRQDINVLEIPVNDIANKQGSLKVANVVMLGAYIALSKVVQKESILEAIKAVLGQHKQHLLDINLRALEEGIKFAMRSAKP
jgi:2-oxoglutarate ferredoxin oxidoreductase subunit gamma